jgi:hypothetical protein
MVHVNAIAPIKLSMSIIKHFGTKTRFFKTRKYKQMTRIENIKWFGSNHITSFHCHF